MEYTERLIRQAQSYWEKGNPIPLTLATKMMGEGLDVETLERKYKA